jgi:hypothetical protein
MGASRFTREVYTAVATKVRAKGGDVSYAGKQRKQRGEGVHPLVDPKGYGLTRRSLPRYTQREDGLWQLTVGEPMLYETRFDTTGSMGGNVKLAFDVLPESYDLVSKVLRRYDPQLLNATFGDVVDDVVLYRSQAEMAEKIAEQLTLMVPEYGGGDGTEDPDYGIFGAAYLTAAHINRYGLKYYDLTVTDAPGRGRIDHKNLVRVYGDTVYEVVRENGYDIDSARLPDTHTMVQSLLERAHGFVLLVGSYARSYWVDLYGVERVIEAESTQHLHYYQALIAGLTEGVLDLRSAVDFLAENGCDRSRARKLVRSVAHIPLAVQQQAPHYNSIPKRGDCFTEKTDLWPVEGVENESMTDTAEDEITWA